MVFPFVLFVAVCLAGLSAYTAYRSRRIDQAFIADGSISHLDGVQVHYHYFEKDRPKTCNSDRTVLLFIHGASGNARDQMLAFKDEFLGEYSLLFVDRPGLGHSQRCSPSYASPRVQARLILKLLAELGVRRCLVVGHSFGASVAAALAIESPSLVKGCAFLAPATHPWPGGVNWYYRVAALPFVGWLFCWTLTLPVGQLLAPYSIRGVFFPSEPPAGYAEHIHLPLLFRPRTFRANAFDIARLKSHLEEQSRQYGSIGQPCLIVTGTEDTVVWPSIHSEGLKRDLPNSSLIRLEGAGHMPHLTHSREIAGHIRQLAEEL